MGIIFLLLVIVLSALSGVLPWRLRGRGVKAFYLCVLPAGIAALFEMVQRSPNPACTIGQAIECLLALSAICLSVTLPVSLLVMQKSVRRAITSGRALWIVLGMTASIFLLRDLLECHGSFPFSQLGLTILEFWAGFPFTHIELVVGAVLALFTVLGLVLRWGPIVPCTFLGIIAVKLFLFIFVGPSGVAYESHVAYPLAMKTDITVLLFGVICGASVGVVLDRQRSRAPRDTAKDRE
jgi:hypothetical protein